MRQLMPSISLVAVLATIIAMMSCTRDQPAKAGSVVLKVFVSASGEITADGETVSLEELSEKMAQLKRDNGTVYYHRENPKGGPHPNAMKVVELVVEHKLPIRMTAKVDGSTTDEAASQPDER